MNEEDNKKEQTDNKKYQINSEYKNMKAAILFLLIFAGICLFVGTIVTLIFSIKNIIVLSAFIPVLIFLILDIILIVLFQQGRFDKGIEKACKPLKLNNSRRNYNNRINEINLDENLKHFQYVSFNQTTNICQQCGYVNKEGEEYCKLCHAKLNKKCKECSTYNDSNAKYCDNCGHKFEK